MVNFRYKSPREVVIVIDKAEKNERKKRILKYVGSRFRAFREECGMSREEVAKQIGVSSRTLASYERGEREINMDNVMKLALVYRTTVTKLTDYKNVINKI